MTEEIFSLPNLHEKMCQTRGSIAVPLDSQATSLPTERICFRARLKKKQVYTPVHSCFTVGKWGVRGSHLHWYVILMKIQDNIS